MKRSVLIILILLICFTHSLPLVSQAPEKTIAQIREFESEEEIENFAARQIGQLTKLKSETGGYALIAAKPYSGKDTIDIYCYKKVGEVWMLKTFSYLWNPEHGKARFTLGGDFINVVNFEWGPEGSADRTGTVVLTIRH